MSTSAEVSQTGCKFVAPSSREALRLVREQLGPDAIVLSNRVIADGIEVFATSESSAVRTKAAEIQGAPPNSPLSISAPSVIHAPVGPVSASDEGSVLRELHSMRGMIEEQLAGLAWNEKQKRDPVRGHLLRTLLGAGFSAWLAKDALKHLPEGQSHAAGMDFVKAELARRLPLLESEDALMDEGGVFALMGPTGVGKTTTTAKLAARCVMRFGADKLALVTTDSYRIGAYEQLRIYGQILGVPVYAVKNPGDLEHVLKDLHDKHMVLIDTVGMSQRDRAVSEQVAMLCGASRPVKRLLLLNASSHGDTLNEVVEAYRHGGQKGSINELAGCIFTKVDEATHPGALIDMAIRHQLPVHYVSGGQRVPENLALADRDALIDSVFQAKSRSALFVPGEADVGDQPTAPNNDVEIAAAEAVSQRLRSQCHQLIRALTHNARELTCTAAALSAGEIGFDEVRLLWGNLTDGQSDEAAIERALQSQAAVDIVSTCGDNVLMITGEPWLTREQSADASISVRELLLSDRTGLPFAALQHMQPSDQFNSRKFDKPVIQLLARVPAPGVLNEWQAEGRQWMASCAATLRVVSPGCDRPETLGRLAAGLSFSAPVPVMFRKKSAFHSVAEVQVSLAPATNDGADDSQGAPLTVRCVVSRLVEAASGKPLAQSYLLASTAVRATASQLAKWPEWRAAAEPFFKLLGQSALQRGDWDQDGQEEGGQQPRILIAAQVCTSVLRLQRAQGHWADTARKVLAQLAGRSVRADRPVSGPALFEGMVKLFALLDALETEGPAGARQSAIALAQG